MRPASTWTRPRMECDCRFRGFRQFVVAERHQPLGFPGRRDPHHAAAVAGQGHEYARTLRGVKLGGDAVVRPRMGDVERQRRLMQVAAADPDSGRLAGRRLPPVGADHQPRGKLLALAGMDGDDRILRVDRCRLIVKSGQVRKLGGALFEGDHQRAVVDVVAELFEADLVRGEPHLGRADQPAGVVDEAHGPQGGGLVAAAAARRPDVRADRWKPPAAPWCGCRHRGRGGRAGRFLRRLRPARWPRSTRPARRRSRRRHKLAMHCSYWDN